jgi:hypothetical protein
VAKKKVEKAVSPSTSPRKSEQAVKKSAVSPTTSPRKSEPAEVSPKEPSPEISPEKAPEILKSPEESPEKEKSAEEASPVVSDHDSEPGSDVELVACKECGDQIENDCRFCPIW